MEIAVSIYHGLIIIIIITIQSVIQSTTCQPPLCTTYDIT